MLRLVINGVSRLQQAPAKTERPETSATPEAPPSRRLLAGAVALVIAIAGIAFVARAFGGGGRTKVGEAPSITPKANGVIYFQGGSGDTETSIDQVGPDGSGERQVFPPNPTDPMRYNEIAWSPDGTRIAYGDNLVDHFGIFPANPDGTNATQLTEGVNDGWPSWSPDGTRIAFSSSQGDPNAKPCGSRVDFQCPADIYVMNADGTGVRRLTVDPATDFQPAWSPDGTKIAFERAIDDGTGTAIFVMNAEGTDVKQVSSGRGGSDMYASWSPDGSKIVFSSIRYEDWGIYVVNADGTDEHPIMAKGGYVDDPVWSPDGRLIAFIGEGFAGAVDTGGESALYVMDSDGTDIAKIADAPAGVAEDLAWQPLPIAESPTPSAPGPVSLRVAATIDVGPSGQTSSILYAEGSVWVSAYGVQGGGGPDQAMLYRIDPATNEVAAAIPVDAAPTWETGWGGIAAGDGSIWVTGSGQGPGAVLQRIDPATNEVVGTYFLGGEFGADVVVDETGVWVLMFDTDTSTEVVRLDPATGDTIATIRLDAEWAHRIFSDAGAIWVNEAMFHNSTFDHSVLVKIDPGTNTVLATLSNAWFEAFDPVTQTIWTTASVAGRAGLARIDPETVQFIGDPVPVTRAIRGMGLIAADSAGVWFESYDHSVDGDPGSIERYNPRIGEVDASVRMPKGGPLQMALSPGSLWTVNSNGTVTRIDLS